MALTTSKVQGHILLAVQRTFSTCTNVGLNRAGSKEKAYLGQPRHDCLDNQWVLYKIKVENILEKLIPHEGTTEVL
jgi:hypothetical protein